MTKVVPLGIHVVLRCLPELIHLYTNGKVIFGSILVLCFDSILVLCIDSSYKGDSSLSMFKYRISISNTQLIS